MGTNDLPSDDITSRRLKTLGEEIRTRRKQLRISAIATAEASAMQALRERNWQPDYAWREVLHESDVPR